MSKASNTSDKQLRAAIEACEEIGRYARELTKQLKGLIGSPLPADSGLSDDMTVRWLVEEFIRRLPEGIDDDPLAKRIVTRMMNCLDDVDIFTLGHLRHHIAEFGRPRAAVRRQKGWNFPRFGMMTRSVLAELVKEFKL